MQFVCWLRKFNFSLKKKLLNTDNFTMESKKSKMAATCDVIYVTIVALETS